METVWLSWVAGVLGGGGGGARIRDLPNWLQNSMKALPQPKLARTVTAFSEACMAYGGGSFEHKL